MSGGGRDTSVSAPSSDTFPWDMDTPTKETATEVLQHLIDTALDDPAEEGVQVVGSRGLDHLCSNVACQPYFTSVY